MTKATTVYSLEVNFVAYIVGKIEKMDDETNASQRKLILISQDSINYASLTGLRFKIHN